MTVCAVFQLLASNVRFPGAAVPSPVSLLATVMVTPAVGSVSSCTSNTATVAVSPVASVASPVTALTVNPASSSSSFVSDTLPAAAAPAYVESVLAGVSRTV